MREAIKGVLKYQRPSEDREDERHLEAPECVGEHYPLQVACALLAKPVLSKFPQWRQPVEVDGAQPIARRTHAHHEQGIQASALMMPELDVRLQLFGQCVASVFLRVEVVVTLDGHEHEELMLRDEVVYSRRLVQYLHSETSRGGRSEAIRGDQRRSEAIRGDQRRSEAIRGDQRRSEAIRGDQRKPNAIRRTPRGNDGRNQTHSDGQ